MTHILYRNESYKMCINTAKICIFAEQQIHTEVCRIDVEFLFIFYRIWMVYVFVYIIVKQH